MNRRTALVIDDDRGLARAFAIALDIHGFTVEHLSDSTRAIAEIERLRPDIVTLDINMPNASGLDILRLVRAHPTLSRTKVIIATAAGMASHDDEINELADLILLKPVSLAQLSALAARFAQQSRVEALTTPTEKVTTDEDTAPVTPVDSSSSDITKRHAITPPNNADAKL